MTAFKIFLDNIIVLPIMFLHISLGSLRQRLRPERAPTHFPAGEVVKKRKGGAQPRLSDLHRSSVSLVWPLEAHYLKSPLEVAHLSENTNENEVDHLKCARFVLWPLEVHYLISPFQEAHLKLSLGISETKALKNLHIVQLFLICLVL